MDFFVSLLLYWQLYEPLYDFMKCLFWLATARIWFCCNAIGVLSGQVLTAGYLQDKGYSLPGGAKGMYPLVSSCQENGDRPIKRENPHKYLLYKPTFSQIMVFLASGDKFSFCLVWPFPFCLYLPPHLPFNISLFCLPVCNLDFISTSDTLLPFCFFLMPFCKLHELSQKAYVAHSLDFC